jgi:hypothetical protein
MSSSPETPEKSPLTAAQSIVTELKGMTPEHQLLALRFATETLGLKSALLPSTAAPPAPAQVLHSTLQQPMGGAEHSTDIRSFTSMKAPKSDQQFTAVVAYFYQFEARPEDRKVAIDADTMKEAARLAGRAQVGRWNMTLTNAKNAGYLDSAGSGKFKLSSVGENLVAITLPGTGGPTRNGGTRKPKKQSVAKNTRKKK